MIWVIDDDTYNRSRIGDGLARAGILDVHMYEDVMSACVHGPEVHT